jgi:molecular chaperone GrpE
MKNKEQKKTATEHQQAQNGDATDKPIEQADEPKEQADEPKEQAEEPQDPSKLEEANDRFLRLFSEFDNYRKRTARERLEFAKTASSDIITALLPVLDDLERACQVEGQGNEGSRPNEGLILILNKFKAILRQKGVEEIPSIGQVFDTDLHEAITHVPASGKDQKGKIIDEVQKGYMLNGKVIRFSRVVVAS